jgi:hypothetical protein
MRAFPCWILKLGRYPRAAPRPGKNLGRLLMIYADAGGRPIAHPVLCHEHSRERLARDGAGLKAFDDREGSAPQSAISRADNAL